VVMQEARDRRRGAPLPVIELIKRVPVTA
jgi:hypothetical protein